MLVPKIEILLYKSTVNVSEKSTFLFIATKNTYMLILFLKHQYWVWSTNINTQWSAVPLSSWVWLFDIDENLGYFFKQDTINHIIFNISEAFISIKKFLSYIYLIYIFENLSAFSWCIEKVVPPPSFSIIIVEILLLHV